MNDHHHPTCNVCREYRKALESKNKILQETIDNWVGRTTKVKALESQLTMANARWKFAEAENARYREAAELAIGVAEDMLGQHGFYDDGKPTHFNTKWGWSEDILKARSSLNHVTEGHTRDNCDKWDVNCPLDHAPAKCFCGGSERGGHYPKKCHDHHRPCDETCKHAPSTGEGCCSAPVRDEHDDGRPFCFNCKKEFVGGTK